jgi:hypothetical protein
LGGAGDVLRGDVLRGDVLRDDVPRDDVLRDDVLRDDVPRGDVLRDDVLRDDVLIKTMPYTTNENKSYPHIKKNSAASKTLDKKQTMWIRSRDK